MLNREALEAFGERGYTGPHPLRRELTQEVFQELQALPDEETGIWDLKKTRMPYLMDTRSYLQSRDRHLENRALFDVATDPAVLEAVQAILGPDLLLWRTQLFRNRPLSKIEERMLEREPLENLKKSRRENNTIWHQGANFAGGNGSPAIVPAVGLTAWIALTDAHEGNGTLSLVPGTHRLGFVPVEPPSAGRFVNEGLGYGLDYSRAVDVAARAGEFVVFNEFLVHGSRRNQSEEARLAVACRFVPTTTHVFPEIYGYEDCTHLGSAFPDPGRTGLEHPAIKYPRRVRALDNWGIPLDNWGCVLVSGEDRCGFNRLVAPPAVTTLSGTF